MSEKSVATLAQEIIDLANQRSGGEPNKSDWKHAIETTYMENLPEGITEDTLNSIKAHNELIGKAATMSAGRSVILDCKSSVAEADSLMVATPLIKYTFGVVKRSKKDGERKIYATTSVWCDMRAEVAAIAEEWESGNVPDAKVTSFDDF